MTSPVKLLIVDDHRVFAEGLESFFRAEPDFEPMAAVTDPSLVLRLMVCGLDRKAISERLNRSPDTVKTHIRNIAAKLGTRSMAEAVAVALHAGLRPVFRY